MPKWTDERRKLAADLYNSGLTQTQVAKKLGTTQGKVWIALKTLGVKARSDGRFSSKNSSGPKNYSWSGGCNIDKSGYVLLWMPGHPDSDAHGYVREHRLVMEQALGRSLDQKEVVHHRNGNRSDNRPENLELFETNGKHLQHELKGHCPNWTPDGRNRILEAACKPLKRKST